MQTVAAEARAAGADTLITCGGVQSNHARVTAAAGAALGMRVDARAERRAAGVADRQRAARSRCSAPRSATSPTARRARADDGGGRRRAARRRPAAVRRPARRLHADRRARLRARRRRARRRRRQARRHRPRVVVGRHAGGTDRRLRAVRPARARPRRQRRRSGRVARATIDRRCSTAMAARLGAKPRDRSARRARSTSTTRTSATATACRRRRRPRRSNSSRAAKASCSIRSTRRRRWPDSIARIRAGAFTPDQTRAFLAHRRRSRAISRRLTSGFEWHCLT